MDQKDKENYFKVKRKVFLYKINILQKFIHLILLMILSDLL